MAWKWRGGGERTYFYHSLRREGRVKKIYFGAGPTGRLAAEVDALRGAERQAEADARKAQKGRLDAAVTLTRDPSAGCELLAAATLLAAGYHRPSSHNWRIWRNGRRALANPE
jgi:hypothetical protein